MCPRPSCRWCWRWRPPIWSAKADPAFQAELAGYLSTYVGRPSPLYFARRLTEHFGGAKIYLKREELNHTGAHKINNCMGQILLARRMGKTRIIAETGAGQHGVATATVCALFGLPCIVYMGAVDVERQAPNVLRMNLLGAEVRPVTSGAATLKDAMNEALRDWVTNVEDTYYLIGSAAGPHPYPVMVRDFQAVIGVETRAQMLDAEGRLPDALVACVGGGSNAIGLFHPFLADEVVRHFRRGGGGRRHGHRRARRGAQWRTAGRVARQQDLPSAGRRRADPGSPFDFRGPGLSGNRSRALHGSTTWAARAISPPPMTRPWRRFSFAPVLKGSSPPWNRPTPWPACLRWPAPWARTPLSC